MFKTYIDYEGHHPIEEGVARDKVGEQWVGDGADYRCTFTAYQRRDVELWLKGVKATMKLLRATLTKGK